LAAVELGALTAKEAHLRRRRANTQLVRRTALPLIADTPHPPVSRTILFAVDVHEGWRRWAPAALLDNHWLFYDNGLVDMALDHVLAHSWHFSLDNGGSPLIAKPKVRGTDRKASAGR
jgi:hypothetical protein